MPIKGYKDHAVSRVMVGLVVISLGILPVMTTADTPSPVAGKRTLVIGKVSDNPKKHYRYLKPIADYVVERMADLGVTEAKVLMAKDNPQMISYLRQGRVDWVTETPFSAVIFEEKAGAEILLRKWKKGVPQYHTIFFTRKDSGIDTLADLRGKTIAFQDRGSTTAYFVPWVILVSNGLGLVELASPREKPPLDRVGYVFSKQEINTSTWVHKGLVEAGAYANLDWNTEDHLPLAFKNDLKIIHRSVPFPRAIELVRKDMDPRIKTRLKTILLNAESDPKAKIALRAYQKTKKFDLVDSQVRAGLAGVRKMLSYVQNDLK